MARRAAATGNRHDAGEHGTKVMVRQKTRCGENRTLSSPDCLTRRRDSKVIRLPSIRSAVNDLINSAHVDVIVLQWNTYTQKARSDRRETIIRDL